jgi:hypothetical protein
MTNLVKIVFGIRQIEVRNMIKIEILVFFTELHIKLFFVLSTNYLKS